MNQTAASSSSSVLATSSYGTLTSVHLILTAVFALLVIVAILYGVRLRHRRAVTERKLEEHAVEAGRMLAPRDPVDHGLSSEPDLPSDRGDVPVAAPFVAATPTDVVPAAAERSLAAAPIAAPAGDAASTSPADQPVTLLKGLGPKVATRLAEVGITSVGQIAALSDDEAGRLDARLGPFSGRMDRDRWVEQARFLAAGDRAGFEAVFGKL